MRSDINAIARKIKDYVEKEVSSHVKKLQVEAKTWKDFSPVISRLDLNSSAKVIYFYLCHHTGRMYIADIVDDCGMGERTVYRALSDLEKEGLITRSPVMKNGIKRMIIRVRKK